MKRILLSTVALTAFAATSAIAADLPARTYTKAPAYVAAYNWTGFYVGLNAGGAFGRLSSVGAGSTDSINGFAGGGQIGYNWQGVGSPWVFGLEADFQGSTQKLSEAGVDPVLGAYSASARLNYFGTIRGRLGVAQDRWLAYITGGYAYQNVKLDVNSAVFGSGSASSTRGGWTVGGGFEYAFAGPWTGGVEYLYLDSGNRDWNFGGNNYELRAKNHVVRAKLNYRF